MNAIKALVDGTIELVEFDNDNSYETIRDAVVGPFDCIAFPTLGVDMWINDEGKINGLELNVFATALFVTEYGYEDIVCGDVLITGGPDSEGRTLGLTDEQGQAVIDTVVAEVKRAVESINPS